MAGVERSQFWQENTYVSLVAFRFLKTRVRGIPIPFHRNFEEINLRFYVRRKAADGQWRRAVVFIREIVPRRAIAWVARVVYNEPYLALPTTHQIERGNNREEIKSVRYSWRFKGRDHFIKLATKGAPRLLDEGSKAEFITEHYWGYTAQRDGSTLEYQVEHPRWRVFEAESAEFNCDVAALYGVSFCDPLNRPPDSAFLAEGSAVKIYEGTSI